MSLIRSSPRRRGDDFITSDPNPATVFFDRKHIYIHTYILNYTFKTRMRDFAGNFFFLFVRCDPTTVSSPPVGTQGAK